MGVRNSKELDFREGRINRLGNAAQPTGLSNIPGPKAPPKFKTAFPNRVSPQVESRAKSTADNTGTWNQVQQGYSAKPPPLIMTQAAPPPPSPPEPARMPRAIDENFGEPDVNRLPRQKTSEDLISAIEDVTQKNDPIYDRLASNKFNINDDTASVTSDPDINYLLKEVEKRAKKQRELDYKIKLNERKLSDKYKNLARESTSVKVAGPNDNADSNQQIKKSVKIAAADGNKDDEKFRREALMRELAEYDELESKKKRRLDEQEKMLSKEDLTPTTPPPPRPRTPSSSFFSPVSIPPPLKLSPPPRKPSSDSADLTKTMVAKKQISIEEKPIAKTTETKQQTPEKTKPLRTTSQPPSTTSHEPKRETLVIPMDVQNRSKGLNEQELKRIISVIDNLEKQSGGKEACPSRYFLDGKEIYATQGALQAPIMAPQPPPQPQVLVQAPPRSVNLNRIITTTYTKTPCKNVYDDILDNYTNRYITEKQQQPYDNSQAAKKLAEINYYLSLANKNAKTVNNENCCGYRMLNKNAELTKVEWDKELLQADEAIAMRLRQKHEILERRAEDSRPKSEFSPKEADLDRSMSMSRQSMSMRQPSIKEDTKEAIKRTLERRQRESMASIYSNNSQLSSPSTPGPITPTNLAIKQAIERRSSMRNPSLTSTPSSPGTPGFRPLNLNGPPPPEIMSRRGSNSSLGSRLSHKFKFWDRGHADSTARNILARVKKPVGA